MFGKTTYREAVYADYYTFDKFFVKGDAKYTGWQTIDGKVYFTAPRRIKDGAIVKVHINECLDYDLVGKVI